MHCHIKIINNMLQTLQQCSCFTHLEKTTMKYNRSELAFHEAMMHGARGGDLTLLTPYNMFPDNIKFKSSADMEPDSDGG